MKRNRILTILVAIIVVLGLLLLMPSIRPPPPRITNRIFLRDVRLCASNCIFPSPTPYLSAIIFVNGSVPSSTLHMFINGTDEGTTSLNMTPNYPLIFEAQPNNSAMPIMAGNAYTILVVATFQDNSSSTVSVTVVAVSDTYGKPQATFRVVLRSDPTQGCITIAHTGPNCAYNGTTEVQWSVGNYEMDAFPNIGYRFVSWNASGGVFVSNPTTSPTTITVISSGTLQANFSVITTTGSLQPQNLQSTIVLVAALTLIIARTATVLYRKRGHT